MMLVLSSAFFVSFHRATSLNIGIDTKHVIAVTLDNHGYTARETEALFQTFRRALEGYPGISTTTVALTAPLISSFVVPVVLPDRRVDTNAPFSVMINRVDGAFFRTVGLVVERGRALGPNDEGNGDVAVINETFARSAWPSADPIGRCFNLAGTKNECVEVVGVVPDGRYTNVREPHMAFAYLPSERRPLTPIRVLLVRTKPIATDMTTSVLKAISNAAPPGPLPQVQAMSDVIQSELGSLEFGGRVFGGFGIIALALAAIGIFTLLGDAVRAGEFEIAVRLALGAKLRHVILLVSRSAGTSTAAGIAIGVIGTVLLKPVMVSVLFDTSPTNPVMMEATGVVLLGLVIAGASVPIGHAMRVQPAALLRG